jgi:hypothetical protein
MALASDASDHQHVRCRRSHLSNGSVDVRSSTSFGGNTYTGPAGDPARPGRRVRRRSASMDRNGSRQSTYTFWVQDTTDFGADPVLHRFPVITACAGAWQRGPCSAPGVACLPACAAVRGSGAALDCKGCRDAATAPATHDPAPAVRLVGHAWRTTCPSVLEGRERHAACSVACARNSTRVDVPARVSACPTPSSSRRRCRALTAGVSCRRLYLEHFPHAHEGVTLLPHAGELHPRRPPRRAGGMVVLSSAPEAACGGAGPGAGRAGRTSR